MGKLKVVMVGTGNIAGIHLGVLTAREDVELAGVFDVVPEAATRAAQKWGTVAYSSLTDMLDQAKPDAVWICTPPTGRGDALLACAQRDIPVFCEKPWGVNSEHGCELLASLPESYLRKIQNGYLFRSMPVVRLLKRLLENDRLVGAHSSYVHDIALTKVVPEWLFDKDKSGGMIIEQGTHNMDLLRYFLGECQEVAGMACNPVTPKGGKYTIEEVVAVPMLFEKSVLATHYHTWVGHGWRNEFQFIGEKAFYRLQPMEQRLIVEDPGEKIAPGTEGMSWHPEWKEHRYQDTEKGIFYYETDHFLQMVRSGDWSENPSTPWEAQTSLEFTFRVDRALSFLG
jgi:myo-inositol 2-dehydrogenase/D-chiro-inositol 1-dehydrogenase